MLPQICSTHGIGILHFRLFVRMCRNPRNSGDGLQGYAMALSRSLLELILTSGIGSFAGMLSPLKPRGQLVRIRITSQRHRTQKLLSSSCDELRSSHRADILKALTTSRNTHPGPVRARIDSIRVTKGSRISIFVTFDKLGRQVLCIGFRGRQYSHFARCEPWRIEDLVDLLQTS